MLPHALTHGLRRLVFIELAVAVAVYRVKSARTGARGTGLGLAIVERVARLHGGSLTLHNLPTAGFEARLSLPL